MIGRRPPAPLPGDDAGQRLGDATNVGGLLSRLEREADDAVAACLTQARAQASALREAARRDADAHRVETLSARTREHEQAQSAARAVAQQHAVRRTLQARAEAVDRVLDTAITRSGALAAHPGLPDMLRADIARAVPHLPDAAVIVRCPASIVQPAREAAAQVDASRTTVTVDPAMAMGIIVQSDDGRVEVNATIARRIACERPRLAIRIARLLTESFA